MYRLLELPYYRWQQIFYHRLVSQFCQNLNVTAVTLLLAQLLHRVDMADCNWASFIPLLIFFKDHNGLGGGQALCVHPGHHGTLTTTASLVQDLNIIIIMYKEKKFCEVKT